jgi:hypothetical protein
MNVQAATNLPLSLSTVHTTRAARSPVRADVQSVPDEARPPVERESDGASIEKAGKHQKSERAHGVLRLLAAGHFKAVPEQRLRANFADLLGTPDEAPPPEAGAAESDSAGTADTTPDAAGPLSVAAQPDAAEPSSIEFQHPIGISERPTIYVNLLDYLA